MNSTGKTDECELFFLEVPPPRSGDIVEFLKEHEPIRQAAAVYSGMDVVTVAEGDQESLDAIAALLLTAGGTPVTKVERFKVDILEDGPQVASRVNWLYGSCHAFVRCSLREEAGIAFIVHSLSKLAGVVRAYGSKDGGEVVLEVIGANKAAFDDVIMQGIQTCAGFVRSTRTYVTISSMHWRREQGALDRSPTVFICLSSNDIHIGESLARRIADDVGIRAWIYTDVPVASELWRSQTLKELRSADLEILLLSRAFLESKECQREFGNIEALKEPNNVLGILLDGVRVQELDLPFQQRQLIHANDILAFARLSSWITGRLAGTPCHDQ